MTQEEVDEQARKNVLDILKREIRLVMKITGDDWEDEEPTWMVKSGNLEHCAKLIVQTLYS